MSNTNSLQNFEAAPKARGLRVESLRGLTHLSRKGFRDRYDIPASTLQYWEDGTGNGLTEKGARKLLAALKADGILCTFEWLMYGIGQGPQILPGSYFISINTNKLVKMEIANSTDNEEAMIAAELLLFRQHYPSAAIALIVPDDGMAPRYIKGEYVAGLKRYQKAIESLIGLDCIVQTNDGDILLRIIKRSEQPQRYNLVCYNPNTTVENPVLYNIELLSAAPVIWARRKNPPN